MPQSQSAGILLFRNNDTKWQVFLVHPGGPFWKKKDAGSWSIPKGEFTDDEEPLTAAKREFEEETGKKLAGNFIKLTPIKQKGGKVVHAWMLQGDIDPLNIVCNTFRMEWPPKSGKWQEFPEVDRGDWFDIDSAKLKINPSQVAFIEEFESVKV